MNHYKKAIEWGKANGLRFMLAIPDAPGVVFTRKGQPDDKIVVALTGNGVVGADKEAVREWAARWYNGYGLGIEYSAKGAILEFKACGEAVFTEAKEFKKNYKWTSDDFIVE